MAASPAGAAGAASVAAAVAASARSPGGPFADEADDVVEGRVVAQLERVVALDPVGLADGGEHLGLLDRVDPQVGLEIEVHVEQILGIARLLRDQPQHLRLDIARRGRSGSSAAAAGAAAGAARRRRCGGRGAALAGSAFADEADDVVEGRVVAQLERVVALDPVGLADGGEHLGLLDGVDPQVGLEIEVHVEQILGIARLLRDQPQHLRLDPARRGRSGSGRSRRSRGGSGAAAGGGGAVRGRPRRERVRGRSRRRG